MNYQPILERYQIRFALSRAKTYKQTVADLFSHFRASGNAVPNLKLKRYFEDRADEERVKLNAQFPKRTKREAKRNILDKESLIKRYHQIYYAGRYPFGIPDNFLSPEKVVRIIKNRR